MAAVTSLGRESVALRLSYKGWKRFATVVFPHLGVPCDFPIRDGNCQHALKLVDACPTLRLSYKGWKLARNIRKEFVSQALRLSYKGWKPFSGRKKSPLPGPLRLSYKGWKPMESARKEYVSPALRLSYKGWKPTTADGP